MTFSLGLTGLRSGYVETNKIVSIPDQTVPTSGTTLTTGTLGGMLGAMRTNLPMLCKNPDGSSSWYTLDAERSTPTTPVLKAV